MRPEETPEIEGSPRDINQLVLNLITNARDAIAGAGRPGCISIRVVAVDGAAALMVADNGNGIAPDDLPRIFDPGFTTKGVGVGTGLGLAICYQIAKAHNGDIEVNSQPGSGSTFTVRLPACAAR